jgi:hypothetical protein
MQFLSEKSYKVTSDTFVVSAPFNVEEFAFNLMNARILVGTRPSTVHLRRTTFRQRVRFWDVIHQFSSTLALWPKSSSVAAYDFLQTTLMFAFNCLCRVAVDEQRKSSERLLCVEDCLKNIEIWFQDAEFQDTLQMMQKWDSAANGFALLLIQCVHLAMMVLKSTSIMEGLECPETSYRATQLLARIVARIVGEVGEEFVDRPYAFGIVLIGLTLPGEAVEEGINSSRNPANVEKDGAFLCNELNGLGQPLLAEAMRNFWENRTLDEVVEVVRSLGFVW